MFNNWELNNKQHSCTDDNCMSRPREDKGFILINKEATTEHILAILPHFRITVFISKLVRLHGLLSFQNKHMSGNLRLLMRKCSDIILK